MVTIRTTRQAMQQLPGRGLSGNIVPAQPMRPVSDAQKERDEIIKQLSAKQKRDLKLGLATLTRGKGSRNFAEWSLKETEKGLSQRKKEFRRDVELGVGFSEAQINKDAQRILNIIGPESEMISREAPSGHVFGPLAKAVKMAEESYQVQKEVRDTRPIIIAPPAPVFERDKITDVRTLRQELRDASYNYQTGIDKFGVGKEGIVTAAVGSGMFGADPLSRLDPRVANIVQAKMESERLRTEALKGFVSALDPMAISEMFLGVGQGASRIRQAGLSQGEFDYRTPAQLHASRAREIDALDAEIRGDVLAGIAGAKASYREDPGKFIARGLGGIAAFTVPAGALARGGKLSRRVGRGYEAIMEPGEFVLESVAGRLRPDLLAKYGSLGPEELAIYGAMKAGEAGIRGARAVGRTADDYITRTFTPELVKMPSTVTATRLGGDVPGSEIPGTFRLPTGVEIGDLNMPPAYLAERYLSKGGTEPGAPSGTFMSPTVVKLGDLEFAPPASSYFNMQSPNLIDINGGKIGTFDKMSTDMWKRYPDSEVLLSSPIDTGRMQTRTREISPGYTIPDYQYHDWGPLLTTSHSYKATIPGQLRNPRTGQLYDVEDLTDAQIEKMNRAAELRKDFLKRQEAIGEDRMQTAIEAGYEPPPYSYYDKKTQTYYYSDADIPGGAVAHFGRKKPFRGQEDPLNDPFYMGSGLVPPQFVDPIFKRMDVYKPELKLKYEETAPPVITSKTFKGVRVDNPLVEIQQELEESIAQEQQFLQDQLPGDIQSTMYPPELFLDVPPGELTPFEETFQGPRLDIPGHPPEVIQVPGDYVTEMNILTPKDEEILKFDIPQDTKLKLAQEARIRARRKVRVSSKKRQQQLKKLGKALKKADRTRRRFVMELFKDEIVIPRVNIPPVNMELIHPRIEKVNIPKVHIEKVNLPPVRLPQINVGKTNVPTVSVPRVHVPPVTGTQTNVEKVNVPAVRIYD